MYHHLWAQLWKTLWQCVENSQRLFQNKTIQNTWKRTLILLLHEWCRLILSFMLWWNHILWNILPCWQRNKLNKNQKWRSKINRFSKWCNKQSKTNKWLHRHNRHSNSLCSKKNHKLLPWKRKWLRKCLLKKENELKRWPMIHLLNLNSKKLIYVHWKLCLKPRKKRHE